MDGERALLDLHGVVAGYDEVEVLRGVSVAVRAQEIVSIIGAIVRNARRNAKWQPRSGTRIINS